MSNWLARFSSSSLLFGVLVAVPIMAPLLSGGFIFALDMVFVPQPPLPTTGSSAFLFDSVTFFLTHIVGSQFVQKLILAAIVILGFMGAWRLVCTIVGGGHHQAAILFVPSLLYICNPFVYSRFMSGQYLVLLGYALLPFFVVAVWRFLERPDFKPSVAVVAWLLAISIVSIHTLGLAFIVALVLAGLWMYRRRGDKQWLGCLGRYGTATAATVIVASSYWLVPLLLGSGRTAETIQRFTAADRSAFATNGEALGVLGNVLALRGFWADAKDLYLMPADLYDWWLLPLLLLWLLVGIGLWRGIQKQRGASLAFMGILVIGVIFAIGTPLNDWLASWLPLFAGYREPQKFAALVAVAYVFFAAQGLLSLQAWFTTWQIDRRVVHAALILVAIVPVATAPLMLGGFHGQLQPRHYPPDWYALNQQFKDQKIEKVLFLPWHLYMRFNFAGRVIANPADKFFAPHMVISGDPELQGAKSYRQSTEQLAIDKLLRLAARNDDTTMGAALRKMGISHVVLAKDFDHAKYYFLDQQKDLQLVSNTKSLKVYAIKSP